MTNNTPEEILKRVTEFINRMDVDSFISLYGPDAIFIDKSGESFQGIEKIKEKMKTYIDMNGKSESRITKVITTGNIALVYRDWTFEATRSDGTSISIGGTGTGVLRRQHNNT